MTNLDLAAALLRTTLATTAACGLAYLLLRVLQVESPRVHRAAWTLVIVQGWLLVPWTFRVETHEPAFVAPPPAVELGRRWGETTAMTSRPAASIGMEPQATTIPGNGAWLAIAAWLAGAGALVLLGGWRYAQVLRALARGAAPDAPQWQAEWRAEVDAARVRSRVELRMTTLLGPLLCWTPLAYLVLAPRRLWIELSSSERQSILRHELAHLRRKDLWTSLAIRGLALPQWFNPLVRLAIRRFDEAGEWAADDLAAAKAPEARLALAHSLLRAAEFAAAPVPGTLSAHGGVLSRRIHRLVTPRFKEESNMKKLLIPALLVALAAAQLIRIEQVAAADPAPSNEGSNRAPATDLAGPQDGTPRAATKGWPDLPPQPAAPVDNAAAPYIIEPPDVIGIEAVRLVPKRSHLLEPFDVVLVRIADAGPEQPIDDNYNVDADGTINFGPGYGRVKVAGLTIKNCRRQIAARLSKSIRGAFTPTVTLVAANAASGVAGQHLVAMDGRVNLGGDYGSVYVAGLTIEESRAAIERKLAERLDDPIIRLDVVQFNSKVVYVVQQGLPEGDMVERCVLPHPITENDNVGELLNRVEPIVPGGYSIAKLTLRRPAPNGVDQEHVMPVVWIEDASEPAPGTNHVLQPGDRIFVEYQAPKLAAEPGAPRAPEAAPAPPTERTYSPYARSPAAPPTPPRQRKGGLAPQKAAAQVQATNRAGDVVVEEVETLTWPAPIPAPPHGARRKAIHILKAQPATEGNLNIDAPPTPSAPGTTRIIAPHPLLMKADGPAPKPGGYSIVADNIEMSPDGKLQVTGLVRVQPLPAPHVPQGWAPRPVPAGAAPQGEVHADVEAESADPDAPMIAYRIQVIEDPHNNLAEFESLRRDGGPTLIGDSETTLAALRILRKNKLIKVLADPQLMCALGQTGQIAVGSEIERGEDDDDAGNADFRQTLAVEVGSRLVGEQLAISVKLKKHHLGQRYQVAVETIVSKRRETIITRALVPRTATPQPPSPTVYVVITPTVIE